MISKMSGEELAELLNGEYIKFLQAQSNILIIQKELESRKKNALPKVPRQEEESKNG